MPRRTDISSILIIGAGPMLLGGCLSLAGPTPAAPAAGTCAARILHPYPAFGERGVVSIYKFVLRRPSRRDRAWFVGGLYPARVRMVPVMLGSESAYFVMSRRPLRSEADLYREVRAVCALEQRRTITLSEYQHSVPEAPR